MGASAASDGYKGKKRSKSQLSSRLDFIKGIGPKTKDELLSTFRSVQSVSSASLEELTTAIGPAKARIVYQAFHAEEETEPTA